MSNLLTIWDRKNKRELRLTEHAYNSYVKRGYPYEVKKETIKVYPPVVTIPAPKEETPAVEEKSETSLSEIVESLEKEPKRRGRPAKDASEE